MALSIESSIENGFNNTKEKNGLIFIGIFFVLDLIINLLFNNLFNPDIPSNFTSTSPETGMRIFNKFISELFSLEIIMVGLIGFLVYEIVIIAALRSFAQDNVHEVQKQFFTRNIGATLLNVIVGGILFTAVVGFGLILLIIPGIFLAISLGFWIIYVAVEDKNFIESLKESWNLTKDNRLSIFGLLVILLVIFILAGMAVGIIIYFVNIFGGVMNPISDILGRLLNGFMIVFELSVLIEAYKQLKED